MLLIKGKSSKNNLVISTFNNEVSLENQVVYSLAQTHSSKGLLSKEWGEHLLASLNTLPLKTNKGINEWINLVWNDFYQWGNDSLQNDSFKLSKFEKEGSSSSVASIWFDNLKPTFLCTGDSYVLLYDSKKEELFAPYPIDDFSKWINSSDGFNWKDEKLPPIYFNGSNEELSEGQSYILCNKSIAKQLIISYLIIKSKDEGYWLKLEAIMNSDLYLSKLFYQNKDAFDLDSFDNVLEDWKNACENEDIFSQYTAKLREYGMIDNVDCSISIISYSEQKNKNKFNSQLNYYRPNVSTNSLVFPNPYKGVQLNKKALTILPDHSVLKYDAGKIIDLLLDNRIFKLYHFTDKANLESIKKNGGLLSWYYSEENEIEINKPGGDDLSRMLDRKYKLHDYVRCSFTKNHPMMFAAIRSMRINDPIILEIDPKIATFETTMFSDMNATKNGHKRGGDLSDFTNIHFETVKQKNQFNLGENEIPYFQAEIMVKTFIPIQYILNLTDFI